LRYLAVVWETAQRPLREHRITIDDDLEDTIRTLDETRRGAELPVQFGRQPGGPWLVVSSNAIFDRDIHPTLHAHSLNLI
jgi:hypothetical protein